MNNFNYTKLTPFKWFVLENFPFIEADFDALTEWQLLCKLGKEINKIIRSTNTLGTQVETLTDYVSNYFDNLDVQDEINNKLNEMAESGELTEIIAQYLQLAGLLCFNTVNDMKNAENLINGSFVKTFGTNTYNDGLGNFYKIREILNTDVVDNINIIALANYNNLIAELIPNAYINNILQQIQLINNKIDIIKNKKVILIGDSFCEQNSDGDITKFYWEYLRDSLGLTQNVDFFASFQSGAGFGNQLFLTKLQDLENTIEDKETITDILVCGGWNDSDTTQPYGTDEMYNNGINAFETYCKQNYPNAKITIAHISWGMPSIMNNNAVWVQMPVSINRYKNSCNVKGWRYLTGVENILHIYNSDYWQSNGSHPKQAGQTLLGTSLASAFITGSTNIYRSKDNTLITASGISATFSQPNISEYIDGDKTEILLQPVGNAGIYITLNSVNCNFDGGHQYEIGTINSEVIQGYGAYNLTNIPIFVAGTFNNVNSVFNGFMDLWIENNKLICRPTCFYNGQRTENINVTAMWFPAFKIQGITLKS